MTPECLILATTAVKHSLDNCAGNSSPTWDLKQIHTRVCTTPIWTHVSDILVGIYGHLFKQWTSIPQEMEKDMLALYIIGINEINSWNQDPPVTAQSHPEMVIDNQDVLLLMYTVHTRWIVY